MRRGVSFWKETFLVAFFNGVMVWMECALSQGWSNTWPPPSPSLHALSASWEEECVPSANRGADCLGETECVSGRDVPGLCVRVSSWTSLSGSCLGPSDNYSEKPFQCFLRTREKHHPWSVCGIIDSRMDSQSCGSGGDEMSSLLAKDQGHPGPIMKCSSPRECWTECGIRSAELSSSRLKELCRQKGQSLPNTTKT